jgi:FkbM family methyltransferase
MGSNSLPSENPAFDFLTPWEGQVPAGFDANVLGQLTDFRFSVSDIPEFGRFDRYISPRPPCIDAEACEWLALFDAIKDARGQFTMLDLGAGYGRWIVAGACTVRRCFPGLRSYVIGVEADPTHFKWMQQHISDNQIDEQSCCLIEAAADVDDGEIWFEQGAPRNWWGQHIKRDPSEPNYGPEDQTSAEKRPAISINRLLRKASTIDLLDMDVQGAEGEIVKAGIKMMTERVKRIFVSTHNDQIQDELREVFRSHGWAPVADHYPLREADTFCGKIMLEDGVHYWTNRHLTEVTQGTTLR